MGKGYGWRGLLIIGLLPAFACIWIRIYVKEPEVWVENKRRQKALGVEVKLPLLAIFKPALLWNTVTGCVWMAANFCAYYSIWALFGTYLQRELGWTPLMVATPLFWANIVVFFSAGMWGAVSDKVGRRWAIMVPCAIGIFITPIYLMTTDPVWIVSGFILQAFFAGAKDSQNPCYLSERFPTEIRATAAGFVYHQGAIWGGFVAPAIAYFAVDQDLGFAVPMMIGTAGSLVVLVMAVFLGPETKGRDLTANIEIIKLAEAV